MSRIVLVTEAFHPAVDESTLTVGHLADQFLRLGHKIQLITAAPGLALHRGSRVVRVRSWDPVGSQVRAALSEFRPDLVLVASPASIGRKALKHAGHLGIPTVTVEHRAPHEFLVEPWATSVPRRSDILLTVSGWQRKSLLDVGHPCTTWQPGVDVDTFTPAVRDPYLHGRWARSHGKTGPLLAVGYVGPLRKREGVRRLRDLDSLTLVRPVLIGEGKQREWLRDRMRRVTFLPELSSVELATAIASLDVLVHPGEQVTAGHALRAAAASGVPVVAARSGASVDLVKHLETGLLFEPESANFADTVATLASRRSREELGQHGRRLAEQRPWSVAVEELLAIIGPLLARPHAA